MVNPVSSAVVIRHANDGDLEWLADLMERAFSRYCKANQREHAKAILSNQLIGSLRTVGTFVIGQHVLVVEVDGVSAGVIQIFEEKSSIIKIGLLIVAEYYRGKGVATALLDHVEHYAAESKIRQLYCNVPSPSVDLIGFLRSKGFRSSGISTDNPIKGVDEYVLYKQLIIDTDVDMQKVAVVPFDMEKHGSQAMTLVLDEIRNQFTCADLNWIDNLFAGRLNAETEGSVNHVIFVAEVDGELTGLVGATLSKSGPIMLMPLVAADIASFEALIVDIQSLLVSYSHKLYVHLAPNADQTICLQRHGWNLEALLPGRYSSTSLAQQWAYKVQQEVTIRTMRIGSDYYDAIVAGTKTIEVRTAYSEIKNYKVDDLIQFEVTLRPSVLTRITAIRVYNDLNSIIETEAWQKIVPGAKSKDAALRELRDLMPNSGEVVEFYVF